jgi:hypothetical protein|tara:strand:- start:777 stop:932 length:156 start_codon:yes stop_codon:yes gene_type:complete
MRKKKELKLIFMLSSDEQVSYAAYGLNFRKENEKASHHDYLFELGKTPHNS